MRDKMRVRTAAQQRLPSKYIIRTLSLFMLAGLVLRNFDTQLPIDTTPKLRNCSLWLHVMRPEPHFTRGSFPARLGSVPGTRPLQLIWRWPRISIS
jgi:hypothetical protein